MTRLHLKFWKIHFVHLCVTGGEHWVRGSSPCCRSKRPRCQRSRTGCFLTIAVILIFSFFSGWSLVKQSTYFDRNSAQKKKVKKTNPHKNSFFSSEKKQVCESVIWTLSPHLNEPKWAAIRDIRLISRKDRKKNLLTKHCSVRLALGGPCPKSWDAGASSCKRFETQKHTFPLPPTHITSSPFKSDVDTRRGS